MKVIVLGAGVVGVTSAWFLRDAGHEVQVIERQPGAALETSFANGGQISVSHAEPWASVAALRQMLKWLGREDSPLLFRLRADWAQWRWSMRFLLECLPSRNRHNVQRILRLALYSRDQLKALRASTGLIYDHSERGILHFYTDRAQLAGAAHTARLMTEYGCTRLTKTPQEVVAIEPALASALPNIVGGDYNAEDESGDAHLFTLQLAERCAAAGVKFDYDTRFERFETSAERIRGVTVRRSDNRAELLQADAYVMALGSYSPLHARQLGIKLLVYPVKGYSVTIPVTDADAAPRVSLTDDAYKLVFSRLGDRLRVAGTAELNGYDTSVNDVRCDAILRRTAQLFPRAGAFAAAERWAGLRPATPSNLPYVSGTHYRNLYLNTGHGTLGWTMACGSGHLLADMVSGRNPDIDPAAYAVSRS